MAPLSDSRLANLAQTMLWDYDHVTPGTIFSKGLRLANADAWRLQAAVARLREDRGERSIGYKIGCVSEDNQRRFGLNHPAFGRLWATEQHSTDAVLRKANYLHPAMEAEFAITLSKSIKPGHTKSADLLAAIEAVYPVIEIHNLILRGEAPHGHELLANNALHAGVVRGMPVAEVANCRKTDLKLIFDGELIDEWKSLVWPNDILQAVAWLSDQLAGQGQYLQQGNVILTGAWGPPIPIAECTQVEVMSSAFGDVRATFV